MITIFYGSLFVVSLICAAIYIFMWHKHFNVDLTLCFTLIPIPILGYYVSSVVRTLEGAVLAQQIIYIGGIFLQLFIVLCIFNLSHINIPKVLRTIAFIVCCVVYASTLTIGYNGLFYKCNCRFWWWKCCFQFVKFLFLHPDLLSQHFFRKTGW